MTTQIATDQKKSLFLYATVMAGSLLMLIPQPVLPFMGLTFMMTGFIGAYIVRSQHKNNALLKNMTTYLIRTIWWSVLLLGIGLFLFISIIYANGDFTTMNEFRNTTESGVLPTDNEVRVMQWEFIQTNATLISWAAIICLLPYPIFLMVRLLTGVHKTLKLEN